jgi:competence protein ComEC
MTRSLPRSGWLALGGVLAALASSALLDSWLGRALLLAAAVGAGAVAAGLFRKRPRTALLLMGATAVLLRVLAGGVLAPSRDPGPLPGDEHPWVATVQRLGSTDGGLQRAMLSVSPTGGDDAAADSRGPWPVYAWLPRYPIVAAGDTIAFRAALEPTPPEAGFGDTLRSLGAAGSARPASFSLVPRSDGPAGLLADLRAGAADRLFAGLPQQEAGLAAGILIGARELVDRSVADAFTTAGLSHIVAISGWNIGVVSAAMVAMLGWLHRRPRSLLVLLTILGYTLVTGASASVVRAAAMGGVVVLARESGRRGSAAAALALAVWGLLLVDPQMVNDVGFQLSTAATCGLLAWATPLQHALETRLPRRVPRWLIETLGVSLAAQAATLPLILLEFGRLSLVAPLANLLAAPLVVPVMIAALLALIVGTGLTWLPPLLLAPAMLAAWAPIGLLIGVANVCASLPFASVTLPPPFDLLGAGVAAAGVAGIALVKSRRGRALHRLDADAHAAAPRKLVPHAPTTQPHPLRVSRLARTSCLVAAALVLGTGAIVAARPNGRFMVAVLDVGQGDSILLQGNHGARVLIDGGPDPNVLLTRLDERIPAWDRRLDLLVLSHPHEDHAAGLPLLLQRFDVRAIADTGMLGNGPGDRAFRQELVERHIEPVRLAEGDHLAIDDASASVLWPVPGSVPLHPANDGAAVNNVSIVLDIRFGERRFLLTGDVQEEIDPQLLGEGITGHGQPRVDLLKVAHHGSATASSQGFLDAIQPRVAFVSAGLGNPYGHPAPSTIERLRGVGASVYRTDLDGTLEATSDGRDLQVSTSGPHSVASARLAIARPAVPHGSAGTGRSGSQSSMFSCALPVASVVVATRAPIAGVGRTARPAVPTRPPADSPRGQPTLGALHIRQDLDIREPRSSSGPRPGGLPCYDQLDERALTRSSRRRAPRTAAGRDPPAPHDRRCRGCRGPGRSVVGPGCPDRPAHRGIGGAAA